MKMFHPIIEEMLQNGLEVTVRKQDGVYHFDLNAGTRGGPLVAVVSGDTLVVTERYHVKTVVSNFDHLCHMVDSSRFGGDNMNFEWRNLLIERGVMGEHE